MATHSEALLDAYAACPRQARGSIPRWRSGSPPSLNRRVVANVGDDMAFGIEQGAPRDAGAMVTFIACPFTSDYPEQREDQPALSKTTSAWSAGNGNGALDAGGIAINTWYNVYLVKRIDTQVVDVLISLSANAPTLPANYSLARRIGSMKTNGSAQWIKFLQNGDEFLWDPTILDVNGVAMSTAVQAPTLSVPPGVSVTALVQVALNPTAVGQLLLLYSPLLSTPQSTSAANWQVVAPTQAPAQVLQ
jgi:hypothetical protein